MTKPRAPAWATLTYLTSTASVCLLALTAVLAMGAVTYGVRERLRTLTARDEYGAHERGLRSIQALLDERSPPTTSIDRGLEQSQGELARFGIAADVLHTVRYFGWNLEPITWL